MVLRAFYLFLSIVQLVLSPVASAIQSNSTQSIEPLEPVIQGVESDSGLLERRIEELAVHQLEALQEGLPEWEFLGPDGNPIRKASDVLPQLREIVSGESGKLSLGFRTPQLDLEVGTAQFETFLEFERDGSLRTRIDGKEEIKGLLRIRLLDESFKLETTREAKLILSPEYALKNADELEKSMISATGVLETQLRALKQIDKGEAKGNQTSHFQKLKTQMVKVALSLVSGWVPSAQADESFDLLLDRGYLALVSITTLLLSVLVVKSFWRSPRLAAFSMVALVAVTAPWWKDLSANDFREFLHKISPENPFPDQVTPDSWKHYFDGAEGRASFYKGRDQLVDALYRSYPFDDDSDSFVRPSTGREETLPWTGLPKGALYRVALIKGVRKEGDGVFFEVPGLEEEVSIDGIPRPNTFFSLDLTIPYVEGKVEELQVESPNAMLWIPEDAGTFTGSNHSGKVVEFYISSDQLEGIFEEYSEFDDQFDLEQVNGVKLRYQFQRSGDFYPLSERPYSFEELRQLTVPGSETTSLSFETQLAEVVHFKFGIEFLGIQVTREEFFEDWEKQLEEALRYRAVETGANSTR